MRRSERIHMSGDEYDVSSRWRHRLCCLSRAGITAKTKRLMRRKLRRQLKPHSRFTNRECFPMRENASMYETYGHIGKTMGEAQPYSGPLCAVMGDIVPHRGHYCQPNWERLYPIWERLSHFRPLGG